jgi:hypothetical protein
VAAGNSGLCVVNISDPADPTLAGDYDTPGEAFGIFVLGNYAYIADYTSLQIADVSDPANPSFAGSYDTPGYAHNVFVSDDYIYVADGSSIQILGFTPTGVDDNSNPLSTCFFLSQNYPNPFNATTVIRYNLPSQSEVIINIYDILGRVQGKQQAGYHQVVWDAGNHSSGLYFYRIQAGEYTETRKMVLLK